MEVAMQMAFTTKMGNAPWVEERGREFNIWLDGLRVMMRPLPDKEGPRKFHEW
jgi:hypothetical protein